MSAEFAKPVFRPPYSPDLNPVELLWAKVKQSLHSTAARTTEAIGRVLGDPLAAVTGSNSLN